MKIGVFVDSISNLFTNGAIQQAYFTYLVLKNVDSNTIMLSNKESIHFQMFEDIKIHNINAETIEKLKESLNNVDTIVFTSLIPSQKSFVNMLKSLNVKVISQFCGNYYIINQEDYVFNCHKRNLYETASFVDCIWILPMYTHMKSYIETITKNKVEIVPYVWNPDIINKLNPKIQDYNNYVILIAEPNVSIHKTSLIPMVICEKSEINNKIISLCSLEHDGFKNMLCNLKIFKNIDFYKRLILIPVLNQLFEKHICPIMISHQILNELNFLHLEMLYLGIPLLHNCEMLENAGYYYPEHDIDLASEQLNYILQTHSKNKTVYEFISKKVLYKFDPNNPFVIEKYCKLLNQ
tara:strand:- start:5578 stop:6630 length:1053 start_codon:yes stop_codon:yes gene_type:complete